MKIIEKIEIKYFRSFADKKVEIVDLKDLNIFSGANDSGKSNVLRALNLFFSKENKIDFYRKLNFENDFSRQQAKKLKSQKKAKTFIEIGILFAPTESQFSRGVLSESFWIFKRFYRDETKIYFKSKGDLKRLEPTGKQKRSITNFLNKIYFQYIPAIKDDKFFDFLINAYQKSLEADLKTESGKLELKIQEKSEELFEKFKGQTVEIHEADFYIPNLEIDFAKTLKIKTENEIDLKNRGDGIQTKFLPPLLDQISKNEKIIIWGFEEPENSLEYKNARELAKSFCENYSKEKQIFITTHSEEFLSLQDKEKISIYKVKRESKTGSEVERYNNDSELFSPVYDQILKDLGAPEDKITLAKIKNILETGNDEIIQKVQGIIDENNVQNQRIENLKNEIAEITKPILISEGNNFEYLKKAKEFFASSLDLKIFEQRELGDNEIEKLFNFLKKTQNCSPKKLFVLDCDSQKVFNQLEKEKTEFLVPLIFAKNEENTKIQKGIENLFSEKFFEKTYQERNKFYETKAKADGGFHEDLNKNKFCDFICKTSNNKADFANFIPLFETIEKLLKINK